MTDPRTTKLPKWAQDELSLLERRVQELKAKIDDLGKPADDDSLITYRLGDEMGWRRLPDSVTVRIKQERHGWIEMRPHGKGGGVREKDSGVLVGASHRLSILPNAANSITLKDER